MIRGNPWPLCFSVEVLAVKRYARRMTHAFDIYWSMRSPYCYIALDRILELQRTYEVEVNVRVVYPIAVRDPDFFKTRAPRHYRSYHLLDSKRSAEFHGIPYRRPVPDPIVQDMKTGEFATEQPHIRKLTRLAVAASEVGGGLAFQNHVMRLLWDGRTDGWNEGRHLADAIRRADLDPVALERMVAESPEYCDSLIEKNQTAQLAAGHAGVPLMVFDGEPFFGQDRVDMLLWRMKQRGLKRRQG